MTNQITKTETQALQKPKEAKEPGVVEQVLGRVNELRGGNMLKVPEGYAVENALQSAYLILIEPNDKTGKTLLETCTKASVANALLDMVVQGLNPLKKQCAFIPYGNRLVCQREYHGTVALAKRYGSVKKITANCIYEKDNFEYEIDPVTGNKKIISHKQEFENIDINKIRGAYATLMLEDGTTYVEIMSMAQIRKAWQQGAMKGESPAHKNFTDRMAMKTVINRACTLFISTSDDAGVYEESEGIDRELPADQVKIEATENANKIPLTFDKSEDVTDKIEPEKPAPAQQETPTQQAQMFTEEQPKGPGF